MIKIGEKPLTVITTHLSEFCRRSVSAPSGSKSTKSRREIRWCPV